MARLDTVLISSSSMGGSGDSILDSRSRRAGDHAIVV